MRYCKRCCYPENAKPTIIFDEDGVCSGCRYHESRSDADIDWDQREAMLARLMEQTRAEAKKRGAPYDCIIPVSGGKDSHFQTWLLTTRYGMNPLLVAFNHTFNTPSGQRNLENLVTRSGCDLLRITPSPCSVRKVSRFMLKRVGDLTWHYHAGIYTVPFQVSARMNIPLIVWGEHGYAELTGMFSIKDFVEFTRWTRKQYDMRGLDVFDVVNDAGNDIELKDMASYIFPSSEDVERVNMRGIYLSNFINWEAKRQTELMIKEWGFAPVTYRRERTFNLYSHIEDHANEVHDYMKFLKFGYGRATDAASREIRLGRLTREEGISLVREYDHVEPSTLSTYLDLYEMDKKEFYALFDAKRDPAIWTRDASGDWALRDACHRQDMDQGHEAFRPAMDAGDHIFAPHNRHLYYNPALPPEPSGDPRLDEPAMKFKVL
ncbi:N-acetyl sugar amidotransferase [Desulfolutivibrio sulfoxidireducens]|uniref:N-acetyl sugar amidotransferase n=1 Tax=Desulfolutivibrio sulfoxidireducens TaxID=2773299 RepID=UPI00159D7073|nr:N-acetyl sugar amidotransferase [Desulfolutivibrio sulfoxidireducens]QLA20629.1 N-acetyl sugar amidotransferase [Desulfolutivibrio sulfoxidireducens]